MDALNALADRVLSLVVPKATAGACCAPEPHKVFCYCSTPHPVIGPIKYMKTCSYNCACQLNCGGCNPVSGC